MQTVDVFNDHMPDFIVIKSGFVVQSSQVRSIVASSSESPLITVTFIDGSVAAVEIDLKLDPVKYADSLCAVLMGKSKQMLWGEM